MPPEAAQKVEALAAQAQRLMATFARAGYEQIAPAIIQPAGLFLDVVGEEPARAHLRLHRSRRRGAVPAPRPHGADLPAAPGALSRGRHAGALLLQRRRPSAISRAAPPARIPREFRQAGIESFAAADREQDDAAVLALIVDALREAGLARFAAALRRPRPVHGAARRAAHAAALAPSSAASFLAPRGVPRRAGAPHLARRAARAWGPARADGRHRSRPAAGGAGPASKPTWSGPGWS